MFTNTSTGSSSSGISFFTFAVHNGCPQKQGLKVFKKHGDSFETTLFALML
jgi:hypothetical protein